MYLPVRILYCSIDYGFVDCMRRHAIIVVLFRAVDVAALVAVALVIGVAADVVRAAIVVVFAAVCLLMFDFLIFF